MIMKSYYIVSNNREKMIIINAISYKISVFIKEERYTDVVDEALLKVINESKRDLRLDIQRIKIMKKTIFGQIGGTYTRVGYYYLPNLLPAEEEIEMGLWGQRHLRYIKQYHKVRLQICC